MKSKSKELNVDSIGEQGFKLTKKEQETISDFIKKQKLKKLNLSSKIAKRVAK